MEPGRGAHLRLVERRDARPWRTPHGAAFETCGGEDLFARVRAGESVNDYETVRLRKDGSLVAVSVAAAPVRDRSGRVLGNMVAYTDIGERQAQAAEVHRLNDELRARVEELAASRARIVAAGDVERRRLERNLHDGAQQRLVALSYSLQRALAKVDADPAAARALLGEAAEELGRALQELRELARGLHPAILTDRGLRPAVDALAARAPLPVEVEEIPDERLPEPVEAAAYYLIAEALTNVAKYAQASAVRVRIAAGDGTSSSRSRMTVSAARTRLPDPACAAWPTGWRRSAARSRSSAPPEPEPSCGPGSRTPVSHPLVAVRHTGDDPERRRDSRCLNGSSTRPCSSATRTGRSTSTRTSSASSSGSTTRRPTDHGS